VGFVPAESCQIRTGDNMYAEALQVCELQEDALSGVQGRFVENSIYDIDEEVANEFDKQFPEKEKVADTTSQKRFLEIIAMRRKPETNEII
jgi:hypothetical protein